MVLRCSNSYCRLFGKDIKILSSWIFSTYKLCTRIPGKGEKSISQETSNWLVKVQYGLSCPVIVFPRHKGFFVRKCWIMNLQPPLLQPSIHHRIINTFYQTLNYVIMEVVYVVSGLNLINDTSWLILMSERTKCPFLVCQNIYFLVR